jgi:HEXXH motif-containing protein
MQFTLDQSAIRSLVGSSETPDIASALAELQYQAGLFSLVQIRDRLRSEAPALGKNFDELFALVQEHSRETQRAVFSQPAYGVWRHVAVHLLGQDAHRTLPELHAGFHFGAAFARFALSCEVLAPTGRSGELTVWSDPDGHISLPGTGTILRARRGMYPYRLAGADVSSTAGGGDLERIRLPIVEGIQLDAVTPELRVGQASGFDYEALDDAGTERWRAVLEPALLTTAAGLPTWRRDRSYLQVVVPVISHSFDIHMSGTFREAPGLMALSWTPDSTLLAEAIVHESHHGKLNALLSVDPLVEEQRTTRYYSPWRDDPRPLLGLIHGIFAFHATLLFWGGLRQRREAALRETRYLQRIGLTYGQVGIALDIAERADALTLLGRMLCEELRTSWRALAHLLDDLDAESRAAIDERLRRHREHWMRDNEPADAEATVQVQPTDGPCVFGWGNATSPHRNASDAAGDRIVEAILEASYAGRVGELKDWVTASDADALARAIFAAHIAYLEERFDDAVRAYARCVLQAPTQAYLWHSYGFALRRAGREAQGHAILRSADELAQNGEFHGAPEPLLPVGVRALQQGLLQDAAL